ncbi:mevalonate kinase family protein [Paludibaculum fermentans]|uniref:mevalonate kinase family protein n=1 Tax=Paludibaculum fermentans TaxID=1473598 RepID=UPI003EB9D7D6
MMIERCAYARAGLIGNPSDGYFGKTIAVIVRNYQARVTMYEAPRIIIRGGHRDRLEFSSYSEFLDDVHLNGYYGGVRLIKAAIKKFNDWCAAKDIRLDRTFAIEYDTNVPVRVGLAGSSAIVTATIRALMAFFHVEIPKPVLPGLILSVELEELGIGAGLQDRVIQVYENAVFMDFEKARMERDGYGLYEPLDPTLLPPLFVAYHDNLAEGTELTHYDLRSRFNRGEQDVLDAIQHWADLAEQSRILLQDGKGMAIGPLMNEAFDLRASLIRISPGNMELVRRGREQGAFTQFCGSGGAIIGCYDGDPARLRRLRISYAEMGAELIVPQIQAVSKTNGEAVGAIRL